MLKKMITALLLFIVPALYANWFYMVPRNAYYQNQEPSDIEKSLTTTPERDETARRMLS
jgi:hypothetical protein